MCKLLKIEKLKSNAYHPQTYGTLERTHQILVEYLKCYILEDQSDWDKGYLMLRLFNTTPHTNTGFKPHELLFDRKPNIPGILQKETSEIQYTG